MTWEPLIVTFGAIFQVLLRKKSPGMVRMIMRLAVA